MRYGKAMAERNRTDKTGFDPRRLKPLHWLAVILGVALALRVIFFLGLCVADDFNYCHLAGKMLRGEPYFSAEGEFRSVRWPVILPVVASFWLFGSSEAAAVWGSMAYSLAGIAVLFLIGRRLFGDRVGLYAGLLLAVFPGDVLYATQLMPDLPVAFFTGLSVLLFLKAEGAPDRRKAMQYYAVCGLAMLGAFLGRVTAVYFFPFFLVFMFSRRRLERGAWLIFAGFGAALGLLYLFYAVKTGEFFYELILLRKIRASAGAGYITPPTFTRNLAYMVPMIVSKVDRLDLLGVHARILLASPYLFGFFYYFIIPCFVYWAVKLQRTMQPDPRNASRRGREVKEVAVTQTGGAFPASSALLIPVLWLLVAYAYGEYGTISLGQYQQLNKLPRFLLVQTMPGLLLLALTADRLIHSGRGGRITMAWGLVGLLFLIVTSIVDARREAGGSLESIAPYRETYAVLKDRPLKDVYVVAGWWPLRMSFYLGRENGYLDPPGGPGNRLQYLKDVRDVREIRDAYVVLDRNPFLGLGDFRFGYSAYPPFVKRTPSHWQPIGAFHNVEVYYAPREVPQAVVESYSNSPGPGVDLSTWEGARSALERAVRERDGELFRQCLSDEFKARYDDTQLQAIFQAFLRAKRPEDVAALDRDNFFIEKGKWRPSVSIQ